MKRAIDTMRHGIRVVVAVAAGAVALFLFAVAMGRILPAIGLHPVTPHCTPKGPQQ